MFNTSLNCFITCFTHFFFYWISSSSIQFDKSQDQIDLPQIGYEVWWDHFHHIEYSLLKRFALSNEHSVGKALIWKRKETWCYIDGMSCSKGENWAISQISSRNISDILIWVGGGIQHTHTHTL